MYLHSRSPLLLVSPLRLRLPLGVLLIPGEFTFRTRLRLRTVTRPVLTHRRVLSPHLNQKLYSRNPFHARCTKNTSYVSFLCFATKLFLITNDSSTNCFDGTTNYSTPRCLFSTIPKLSFEIVIFLSVDVCFLDSLFFYI